MSSDIRSFELNGFQRDLLYVIVGLDGPSGQDISRELNKHMAHVGHGQLYSNLDTLVEKELVRKGSKNQRANRYELTQAGLSLLRDRREWENSYMSTACGSDWQ